MRLPITPAFLSAGILLSALAVSANGQPPRDHDANALDTTTTEAETPPPPMTPEQVALIERYLTAVRAQPVSKIDTRTAAAGQGVTLQVTQDATLANGTELPKGTKLTGRILRAQAWQQEGPAAVLSIAIDRAILKDGSSIPIRCVLRAVASTAAVPSSGLADASQSGSRRRAGGGGSSVGGTSPLGDPTPMGGSVGAGSSAGDIDNSPLGGAGSSGNGSSYPGASSNPNSTATRGTVTGGLPGGDPGVGGNSGRIPMPNTTAVPASAAPELPVASAGEDIHDTPHRTGLPGIMLSGASVAGVSGTLSAFDHNVSLDSSTQLTLGVITAR